MSNKYRWIETLGGPHLLLVEELLPFWRGNEGWNKHNNASDTSDYARACRVKTWLGLIACDGGMALVLSGDVGAIAWLPSRDCCGGFLVQWIGVNKENDIEPALKSREMKDILSNPNVEKVKFSTGHSGLIRLIDSVFPGNQLSAGNEVLELQPGEYSIRAGYFESKSLRMVVRQLSKI